MLWSMAMKPQLRLAKEMPKLSSYITWSIATIISRSPKTSDAFHNTLLIYRSQDTDDLMVVVPGNARAKFEQWAEKKMR